MSKQKLYDQWVDDVCKWINTFFKKHGLNDAVIQSIPKALESEITTMIIGICPNEKLDKDEQPGEWADRGRFYDGNGGNIEDLEWWNSFFGAIAGSELKPYFSKEKTVFLNRIFVGFHGRVKGLIPALQEKGLTADDMRELFEKSAELTLRAIKEVFQPKVVVCLSVGWVFDYLRKRAGKNNFRMLWRGKYSKDGKCCKFNFAVGEYCGTKIVGIFHPTGARGIRSIDKELAMEFLKEHIINNKN